MGSTDHHIPRATPSTSLQLLEEQLADYRTILRLAQQEEAAVTATCLTDFYHAYTQREHFIQNVLARTQWLPIHGSVLPTAWQPVLEEIATTIEAVLALDKRIMCHLEAQCDTVAGLLQKLKEARTALHQYAPAPDNPPHFMDRTV